MSAGRFGEYSGDEYEGISIKNRESLKRLEQVQTLLMYEYGVEGPNTDVVRVGQMRDIRVSGGEISFRFTETGRIPRGKVDELAHRLQLSRWEQTRTHWAVKDGSIPQELLLAMKETPKRYDLVLSFAGEDLWTRHERRAALARAMAERVEYVLPARFDDTEIPGLNPVVGYLDLKEVSPKQLGEMILQKLGRT